MSNSSRWITFFLLVAAVFAASYLLTVRARGVRVSEPAPGPNKNAADVEAKVKEERQVKKRIDSLRAQVRVLDRELTAKKDRVAAKLHVLPQTPKEAGPLSLDDRVGEAMTRLFVEQTHDGLLTFARVDLKLEPPQVEEYHRRLKERLGAASGASLMNGGANSVLEEELLVPMLSAEQLARFRDLRQPRADEASPETYLIRSVLSTDEALAKSIAVTLKEEGYMGIASLTEKIVAEEDIEAFLKAQALAVERTKARVAAILTLDQMAMLGEHLAGQLNFVRACAEEYRKATEGER